MVWTSCGEHQPNQRSLSATLTRMTAGLSKFSMTWKAQSEYGTLAWTLGGRTGMRSWGCAEWQPRCGDSPHVALSRVQQWCSSDNHQIHSYLMTTRAAPCRSEWCLSLDRKQKGGCCEKEKCKRKEAFQMGVREPNMSYDSMTDLMIRRLILRYGD